METPVLLAVAAAVLGFGLISGRAEKSIFTPPIVFVALGAVAALLGGVHLHVDEHLIHTLAEITLVLVLFTDASRIDLRSLRREHDLPVRLLLVGMPLTILFGAAVAVGLFPHLTLWEAALLAAVLAPTDAALGQAVVSSPKVPVRIRQTLNVESGLNDGIALPLVLLMMSACASAVDGLGGAEYWLRFAALQVTLGPLVGWLVGWVGGKAVERATKAGWMNHAFQHLASLALALMAYAGAEWVGGNGFIAAFIAGLTLGNTCRQLCACLIDFAEAEGQLLTLLVFLVFGAVLLPEALGHLAGWQPWVYGILALTVIRMLPVALSLVGKGLRPATVLFLGWFGPRGIASILFGLVVVERSGLSHRSDLFAIVVVTVLLSVVLHGITAHPWSGWYARHVGSLEPEDAAEHRDVGEMPVRIRHRT
ncbi:MAG: cation:proton antiporter [Acidobacteriota bacterium]